LVLVGDAAHACLPFTSQGANSALADAAVLAKLLAKVENTDELRIAFKSYSAQRRPRNHKVFAEGRKLRDAFLQPLGLQPPAVPLVQ
jgi:salicylate hydroxylase